MITIGFVLLGCCMGFFSLLIFRMSIHQNQFNWTGPVATLTTLAGGSFVTFSRDPLYFSMYSIGFFLGVVFYLAYLYFQSKGKFAIHLSGSNQADPVRIASAVVMCREQNPNKPIYFQPLVLREHDREIFSAEPDWQPSQQTIEFLTDYQKHIGDEAEIRSFIDIFLRTYAGNEGLSANTKDQEDT